MAEKKVAGLKKAREFVQIIKAQGIKINRAYLYGSYAQGVPQLDSDIDIALVSSDFTGNRAEDWDRWIRFRRNIDLRIEPVFYRPDDFIDDDPLVWQIKQTGIKISIV